MATAETKHRATVAKAKAAILAGTYRKLRKPKKVKRAAPVITGVDRKVVAAVRTKNEKAARVRKAWRKAVRGA